MVPAPLSAIHFAGQIGIMLIVMTTSSRHVPLVRSPSSKERASSGRVSGAPNEEGEIMNRLSVLGGLRGRGRGRALALAVSAFAASLLSASANVSAADHGVVGSLYNQRQSNTRKTLKIRSKDLNVSLPTSDPTTLGGTLLVE